MAIAYDLVVVLEDATGKNASTTLNVPRGGSLSDYSDFAVGIAQNIDAIVSGKISGIDLCLEADLSGLALNNAEDNSDVEELMAFQFRTAEGRPVNLNLPGISEGGPYAKTSNDLDQSEIPMAQVIAMMENGITTSGGLIQPCDVAEDDIVDTNYARERFRASGSRR